jgi:hypothetical protein
MFIFTNAALIVAVTTIVLYKFAVVALFFIAEKTVITFTLKFKL